MMPNPMRSRKAVTKTKKTTRFRTVSKLAGARFDKGDDTLAHSWKISGARAAGIDPAKK